ncbi:MAG: RHS repeat-associated core domain-containing protein, partial [Caldisericaceae bacterium]
MFYSIYGKISTEDSEALMGFQISLWQNESLLQTAITDSNGNYAFYNLDNGSYTVIPESRCNFTPQINSVFVYCGDYELNFTCIPRVGEKNEKPLDNTGKENDNESVKDEGNMAQNIQNTRKEALEPIYYFYTWDHLGTVRLITDSTCAIVSKHDYEPFGVELPPINDIAGNTHKFTGQERDTFTNFDYMHFRFYASSIGRFLKPDNIIPNVYNPQSWNLYSYVNGNPVNFNDPLGHYCKASNTSQVLFGPGGALGLSPAYGGIWENPQENGTLSGVDAGYYGGAEYSGTERGYWAYTQTYEEQTIEMWLKVNENGYYTLYGESLFAGTQYDWVVYPMRELTVVGHRRWVEVGGEGKTLEKFKDDFIKRNFKFVDEKLKSPKMQKMFRDWAVLTAAGAMIETGLLGEEAGAKFAFVNPLGGITVMVISAVPITIGAIILSDYFLETN